MRLTADTYSLYIGRYSPAFFSASAAMGTVELTGLEMMQTKALGHALATAFDRLATIVALTLNKSSLVMPGLRGTPAVEMNGFVSSG